MRDINGLMEQINIAPQLEDQELADIGIRAADGFEADNETRSEWLQKVDRWMKLVLQHSEMKTYPWPGAANIKYPLLAVAALQFQARAYPALINTSGNLVKGQVIGEDPDGTKTKQATRVAKHMTYQILHEMNEFENDMDKMLFTLPIVGCAFKKTYFSSLKQMNVSELISAQDLVVDYYAKSLDTARRISQIIYMDHNDIRSRQLAEVFLDVDLGEPTRDEFNAGKWNDAGRQGIADTGSADGVPFKLIEQHCWLDLDDDGYQEPYIVTFDLASRKVLRIVARYDESTIKRNNSGKVYEIEPIKYFTKYSFIPNPDGGFYDVGFGLLLETLNETVNTLLNQLTDSGSMSTLQSGFLSKGIRLKAGAAAFRPGEWKTINTTGDDLKKSILPLPVREPSSVLFNLLGMLIQSGKDLTSVQDINVGKMPGQNTPATTTMASIQEGQKVFTSIYKRIYRSLSEEFHKMFRLNKLYLPVEHEWQMLGIEPPPYIQGNDYRSSGFRIMPAADPNVASDAIQLQRAEANLQLLGTGLLNPQIVVKNYLEAQQQPNIEQLMQVEPPQPDPQVQMDQVKLQMEQQKMQQDFQIAQAELQLKAKQMDYEAVNKSEQQDKQHRIQNEQLTIQQQQIIAQVMKNLQDSKDKALDRISKERPE